MMSGTYEAHNHYLTGNIPAEIAENFKEFFPEDGDISYEEFLQQQETVYQSIQANGNSRYLTSDHGQTSNYSLSSAWEAESSHGASFESQLDMDMDEALARSLQDLGEDFEDFHISENMGAVAETRDSTPRPTPARVVPRNVREDDIDPDNMTYEELQSLGDAVGHESKGLSDEMISRLPTFKYKVGLFSKKRISEECVICCSGYKNGAHLITLPCAHLYHSDCIIRWLKDKKNCPVCQAKVQVTDSL